MMNAADFKVSSSPPLIPYYQLAGDNHPDGRDTWITPASLSVLKHIPGVPFVYADEEDAGLVLYVRGVPFGITSNVFRDMFMSFGRVMSSPVLICLGSKETFRWVIMKHADDARDAKRALHGSTHESGNQLFISTGMRPGEVLDLLGKELPRGIQPSKGHDTQQHGVGGHGHPPPPAVQGSKPLQPAVPKVVVPDIALPVVQGGPVSVAPAVASRRPTTQPPIRTSTQPAPATRPAQGVAGSRETPSNATTSSGDKTVKAKSPVPESTTKPSGRQPSSWANIASSSNPLNRNINLHPETKGGIPAPRLSSLGRIPALLRSREESLGEQMRLVFLLNIPLNIGLQEVTEAISEGPLVRIQFGFDNDTNARYVGIVFQLAEHAEAFYNVLIKERERSRPKRFRFIVDVVRGDPVPEDATIKSMNGHPWATRRLTIVKGKFFFMFGERKLKDLCCRIVGEESVQLVWLYNGGNATVVFSDVPSAVKVKRVLDRKAGAISNGVEGGETIVWKGLQTTFSKDPCIHPLDLKTTMHD